MFDNKVPKYSKIEVIGKGVGEMWTYFDAGLVITGNHLIVVLDEKGEIETTSSSTGHIHNLSNIKTYTTHNE